MHKINSRAELRLGTQPLMPPRRVVTAPAVRFAFFQASGLPAAESPPPDDKQDGSRQSSPRPSIDPSRRCGKKLVEGGKANAALSVQQMRLRRGYSALPLLVGSPSGIRTHLLRV
jgi:hypothetical protein